MKRATLICVLTLLSTVLAHAEAPAPGNNAVPTNKLLYMYRFYYLPFSVEFQEGRTPNDILPFFPGENKSALKLLSADQLESLDADWARVRAGFPAKSLFLTTQVPIGQSKRISPKLASHVIPLSRGPFDSLPINDRIVLTNMLKAKAPAVQAAFTQLRFLKSFLGPQDENKFVFFVVGASWCQSSREYRMLLETYFKDFPSADVSLHSIVIDDPKEQVFESKVLKDLFPNPSKYSHNNLPRFVAIETVKGVATVYEEGEALQQLYDRFFFQHRGYLDGRTQLLKGKQRPVDPVLSSVAK